MEDSEIRKQWHAPFCSAVRLELRDNKSDMEFRDEFHLSSEPLRIDLLVIHKSQEHPINNEIGKLFLGYNLMEYKSPGDEMGIDLYYKVLGYACLFKSLGEKEDSIKADDITLSFVREGYPEKMFHYFKEKGFGIEEKYPGIYHVTGTLLFPMQVIVTGRLKKEDHIWLSSLTRRLDEQTAKKLIIEISQMREKEDLENANAVLNLVMETNRQLFKTVKEGKPVFEALEELLKPSTDRKIYEAVKKTTEEVTEKVSGQTRVQAIEGIMQKFSVSLEEACEAVGWTVEQFMQVKGEMDPSGKG